MDKLTYSTELESLGAYDVVVVGVRTSCRNGDCDGGEK